MTQFLETTTTLSPHISGGEIDREKHVNQVLSHFQEPHFSLLEKGMVKRHHANIAEYSSQHLIKLMVWFGSKQRLDQGKPLWQALIDAAPM